MSVYRNTRVQYVTIAILVLLLSSVSGFTITNIEYTLEANPSIIDQIQFDLDAAARTAWISVDGGNTWVNCDETFPIHPTCYTSGGAIAALNIANFRIVATD